ncbi:PrsW family intramembrane metalloprotease [Puia dinghuensis]|uniref:PrsW family intramembrane metalloprotease n=1 Tax=Puia dinghuensis TaxID=1792502 RepID=A0A8J2UDD7_9BACT|nr:PrsW family glutamic-type intramembrane protease [Puia dinghuensis]GGB00178.1 hypothetical protein GCM10011511_24390 [Puia dinghuensis]
MAETHQSATRLTLECVAGKDQNRRIVVDERPVRIAHAALQPNLAVSELTPAQGYIIARAEKGQLLLDAQNCLLPVYLNDQEIKAANMRDEDVLRIGNSIWCIRPAASLGERFSDLIGLEALTDFKFSEVFSEVFKKHTQEDMEEQLITGTARHTPALSELAVGWGKPWLFARLLGWSALLALVLYVAFDFFRNIKLIPGLIFVGSFAVPFSTLIFFLEMNVPRNISIFKMMQLLFIGGVASIFVALIFFNRLDFLNSFFGASAAGIIEESAKLLIVIALMGKTRQYNWILNGLLFGAAVGTGFAAFESAGYALETMLGYNSVEAGAVLILLRGVTAPFTHIIWTANSAAALWLVKGDRPFSWNMVQRPVFLRVFISSVVLHMLWDAPFSLIPLPLVLDLKFVILGVLGWVITLRLIQAGLRQLSDARREAGVTTMSLSASPPGLLPQPDGDTQRETQQVTPP